MSTTLLSPGKSSEYLTFLVNKPRRLSLCFLKCVALWSDASCPRKLIKECTLVHGKRYIYKGTKLVYGYRNVRTYFHICESFTAHFICATRLDDIKRHRSCVITILTPSIVLWPYIDAIRLPNIPCIVVHLWPACCFSVIDGTEDSLHYGTSLCLAAVVAGRCALEDCLNVDYARYQGVTQELGGYGGGQLNVASGTLIQAFCRNLWQEYNTWALPDQSRVPWICVVIELEYKIFKKGLIWNWIQQNETEIMNQLKIKQWQHFLHNFWHVQHSSQWPTLAETSKMSEHFSFEYESVHLSVKWVDTQQCIWSTVWHVKLLNFKINLVKYRCWGTNFPIRSLLICCRRVLLYYWFEFHLV